MKPNPRIGEGFTLADTVKFECPFCSLQVIAGFEGGFETSGEVLRVGPGAVLHAMPPCQTYLDNDCDIYLELCRKRKQS